MKSNKDQIKPYPEIDSASIFEQYNLALHKITLEREVVNVDTNSSYTSKLELQFDTLKENLYLRAIRNLHKKISFIKLYNQLLEGDITEEDYEKELSERSDKYAIEVKINDNYDEFSTIVDIARKIQEEITIDEASEMFGISLSKKDFEHSND